MNLFFRYFGIIVLLSSSISSCKKSSEKPLRDPDKLRLSRIVNSMISDKSVTVHSFVYDDQQRVDKIIYSQGDFYADTVQYYYNGSDKNPYRSSGRIPFWGWVGDRYYTYNNSGALIQDSVRSASASHSDMMIRNYTYSPGKIIVMRATYQAIQGGGIAFNATSDSIELNGSNIAEVMYLPESPFGTGNFYRCTYDENINPISRLNIAATKVIEGINGSFPNHTTPGICKNNIIEYTGGTFSFWSSPITLSTQKILYTYTREGLPETCVIKNQTNTYKYEYIYEEF